MHVHSEHDRVKGLYILHETKVQAWPNGEIVFYRAPGNVQIVTPRKQNGGGGVMFWGCMSHHAWGPLVVCQGTINGEKYLDILKDYVVPEMESSPERLIFQQDNAPGHKKREIIEFLEAQSFETLEWPPQSPDLSPIEWIWNNIKMKMKAMDPRPRTPATIREAILDIWVNLDDRSRIKTCDTFRQRLRECIVVFYEFCFNFNCFLFWYRSGNDAWFPIISLQRLCSIPLSWLEFGYSHQICFWYSWCISSWTGESSTSSIPQCRNKTNFKDFDLWNSNGCGLFYDAVGDVIRNWNLIGLVD